MYICVCKAVSERRIHKAVSEGVCALRGLTRELGLATVCGKCVPAAREALTAALAQQAAARVALTPPVDAARSGRCAA